MIIRLSENNIELQEIEKEYFDNFKVYEGTLSGFWCESLCIVGDMLVPKTKCGVFCDNNYWWDEGNTRFSVFMTENGNVMLRDWTKDKMYRVTINR